MPLFALDQELIFPPVSLAEPDGLLAVGGDLSIQRLLLAYRNGIFPWYEGKHILWWSPDPRFVLFPEELKVSKSMRQLIRRGSFEFTVNKAFDKVIGNCKTISDEVKEAYGRLHRDGYAHSAEVFLNGELVGGLYGVRLGRVFFGESMFSKVSNASKYAFICYVGQLRKENVELIDCQVYTEHLESMGARMIPRAAFIERIRTLGV
jgi:leucyl/phenylalanyl-tRNA--protein transferase